MRAQALRRTQNVRAAERTRSFPIIQLAGGTGDRRDFRGNGSPICRDKPSLGEAALTAILFGRNRDLRLSTQFVRLRRYFSDRELVATQATRQCSSDWQIGQGPNFRFGIIRLLFSLVASSMTF